MSEREAYRIHPLTAEFASRETEQAFRSYIRDTRVRDTRLAIGLAALFYLAFGLTDYLAIGTREDYPFVLAARLGVTAFGLGAAALAARLWPWLLNGLIPTLAIAVAMAVFLAIVPIVPLRPGLHGMGMMAMLLGVYVFIPNRFMHATLVAVLSTAVFIWVGLRFVDIPPGYVPTFVALLVVLNILGIMAAYRISRLMREAYRDAAVLQEANARLAAEIEARQGLEAELRAAALNDDLTGAANRRHFYELGSREILAARRRGASLALLLIDIDHFKRINDDYGQVRGDEVLLTLANVCRQHLREGDLFARLGGEEFAVLLPDTEPALARTLAEAIRRAVERTPVRLVDVTLHFTVSVGVAAWLHGEPLNALMHRANLGLQAAKAAGRNRSMQGGIEAAA